MIEVKNYPKVQTKLREYTKTLLVNWVKNAAGEEPGEITTEHVDQVIDSLIIGNLRLLYGFFDDNYVYLQPHLIEQLNTEEGWGYELSYPGGILDEEKSYKTRVDAENDGFLECFKVLEERL